MNKINENTALENNEEKPKGIKRIFSIFGWSLFCLFFVTLLIYVGAKTFRDQNPSEVSVRFVRNNEIVKQKTGGIVRIQGYGGRKINGNSWETMGKIYGNENNIEVTIFGYCGDGTSDSGSHCGVSKAKYRNANDFATDWNDGDWHEIEIGWVEKTLLVFK